MEKKLTNSQLKSRIIGQSKKAKPEVRKELEKIIKYADRAELEKILKKMKVTRSGDIDLT